MVATEIAPLFQDLFQTSLDNGEIPDIWKKANVTPLFKKGDKSIASNYRGVSLTCIASEIMEHILHSFIMKHLESNNILTDYQHGFRSKRSTDTQLILTLNDIASQLDRNLTVDAAILDFSKAFDKVPHKRFISKLNYYGIMGPISNWLRNFLTGRTQRVLVDGAISTEVQVSSGVPQGTVLGPLGFLLYINDLPNRLTSTARLFADDCLLYNTIRTERDITEFQADLQRLEEWQKTWLMEFNPSKCCTMNFKTRNPPQRHYNFCGQQLERVSSATYLGVNISETLDWSPHTSITVKKAQRTLGVIRRNLWSCNSKVKITAYKTLVHPILDYASTSWAPHRQKNINALNNIQRQAARFSKSEYGREPGTVTRILRELEWSPLDEERKTKRLVMMYKMMNNLVDIPISNYVTLNNRDTRGHNQKLIQPRHNKAAYQYSFFPSTIADWNRLPAIVVNAPTLQIFKTEIKNFHRSRPE